MILIITASIIGVVLLFASFLLKQTSSLLHLVTVLFAALFGVAIWESLQASAILTQSFYLDAIRVDRFTNQFNVLVTGCLFLYILLMKKHIAAVGKYKAEYFALIAFIMVGIFMLSSFNSLLVMFLGIEIVSIPQYILAGSDKENLKSPAWKNNQSYFKSMPLIFVFREFERQYKVILDYQLIDTSQKFTGSFAHDDLDLALKAITLPLNIKFEKLKQSKIILSSE